MYKRQFLQTLYGMADLFIIGQFDGAAGTTAVSIGSQVMHMITVIIVGLAMGTTVSIAQAVGAKDKKQASRCTGNTITLFLGVSVVLMVILLLLVKPIVLVMSTPSEAVSGTVAYLTICFIGIPFITAYNIISSIFRGLGDSKSPMYFIAVACAANIALDYLFMGALHLGPSGAALGTTLSQTLSVILALIAIRKRDTGIRLTRSDLSPQTAVMGQILKIGVPIALQDGFIQIAFIIITIIANRRGLEAAAAVGIVEKIISFLFLIPSSMLSTVSALGAQNIGAGKMERVRSGFKAGLVMSVAVALVFMGAYVFRGENLLLLFMNSTSAEAIEIGKKFLLIVSLCYLFLALKLAADGVLRGAGAMVYFMITTFLDLILRVVLAFILVHPFGITGIWLSWPFGWVISSTLSLAFYLFGVWNPLKKKA